MRWICSTASNSFFTGMHKGTASCAFRAFHAFRFFRKGGRTEGAAGTWGGRRAGEYLCGILLSSHFLSSGMQEPVCKEQYPLATVIASDLLSVTIYAIGAFILLQYGIVWVIGYLIFIFILQFRLLSGHGYA